MRAKRQWFAFALALCMLAVLLAACSQAPSSTPSPSSSPAGASAPAQSVAEEPAEPVEIVFFNSLFPYTEGTGDAAVIEEVQKHIEELSGIRVTAIVPQKGAEETKLNMLLASGDQLDFFTSNASKYKALDAIQPVTQLVEQYGQNYVAAWPEDAWIPLTDSSGEIWGLPRGVSSTLYPTLLREDWLEKVGLPVPTTVEEFEAVLKAFKEQDPAGNGKTIPLIGTLAGLQFGLLGAYTENGNSNWLDPEDNQIKPVALHPGYLEWLETTSRWYREGYLFKEAFIATTEQLASYVTQNQVGGGITWYSNIVMPTAALQDAVPEAEYILTPLTGPMGKTETMNRQADVGYLISKKSQHADTVVQYLNWGFSSYDNYLTSRYGIKDVHWSYVQNDAEMVVVDIVADSGYNGEFTTQGYSSSPNQPVLGSLDPTKKNMYDYIRTEFYNYDRVKMPFDLAVNYDSDITAQNVPGLSDINRMLEETTIKFITGARPLSEYDQFVNELYDVGLQDYIDNLTAQYNAAQ